MRVELCHCLERGVGGCPALDIIERQRMELAAKDVIIAGLTLTVARQQVKPPGESQHPATGSVQ